MNDWKTKLSSINDGYLIIDNKTFEVVGIIEADNDGRHDMEVMMKMNQLGYGIWRLNFDDLTNRGQKFKQKIQIQEVTRRLMEGI